MPNTGNARVLLATALATFGIAFSLATPALALADTVAAAAADSTVSSTETRNSLSEEQQKSLVRNLKTDKDEDNSPFGFLDKFELRTRERSEKMF